MPIHRSSLRGVVFAVASVAYAASAGAKCEVTGPPVFRPDSTLGLCAPPSCGCRWADENGTVISTQPCIAPNAPAVFRVCTCDAGLGVRWRPSGHSASAAYRGIFTGARETSHGIGMRTSGPVPQDGEGGNSPGLAALGPDGGHAADLAPVAKPNPFHGTARLAFTVPDAAGADVDLAVFDVAGRRMASLARGWRGAGPHLLQWGGRGLDGARVRGGTYFVRGRIGQAEVTTSIMKIE